MKLLFPHFEGVVGIVGSSSSSATGARGRISQLPLGAGVGLCVLQGLEVRARLRGHAVFGLLPFERRLGDGAGRSAAEDGRCGEQAERAGGGLLPDGLWAHSLRLLGGRLNCPDEGAVAEEVSTWLLAQGLALRQLALESLLSVRVAK